MLAMSGTILKKEKFQFEPKAFGAAWIARIWVWSKFMKKQQWLWVLWASASWAKASWARASASISAAAAWVVSRWTTRESFSLLLAALNSVQQEDHSHSQQHQWLLLQVISSCLHTIGMNLGASGLGNSLVISKRLSAQGWRLNWSPPHTLHWRAQRRQVMYIGRRHLDLKIHVLS